MSGKKHLVERRVLARLKPLCEMNGTSLDELAGKTPVEALPAGHTLFRYDQVGNATIYLLDGTVELITRQGASRLVEGGSEEAAHPLCPEKPRQLMAVSKTPVTLIRINDTLMEVLLGHNRGHAKHEEEDADSAENELFAQLYYDFTQNQLKVPSMPDIAVRVRKAVQDEGKGADAIAKLIQTDPPLAARVMQVANSPLYRGNANITNLRMAVTRLGLGTTRNLVMSFSLSNLFQTKTPLLRQRMIELWKHTTLIAALSAILGRMCKDFDVDRALLAGLVHDIGVLPILSYAEEFPELSADPQALEHAVQSLRGQIGALVLRQWEFDEDLVTVALEAEDWRRNPGDKADYCDIVLIAHLHGVIGTPMMTRLPAIDEVPAFEKLAIGALSPRKSLQVLEEARADVAEVQKLLTG